MHFFFFSLPAHQDMPKLLETTGAPTQISHFLKKLHQSSPYHLGFTAFLQSS